MFSKLGSEPFRGGVAGGVGEQFFGELKNYKSNPPMIFFPRTALTRFIIHPLYVQKNKYIRRRHTCYEIIETDQSKI